MLPRQSLSGSIWEIISHLESSGLGGTMGMFLMAVNNMVKIFRAVNFVCICHGFQNHQNTRKCNVLKIIEKCDL